VTAPLPVEIVQRKAPTYVHIPDGVFIGKDTSESTGMLVKPGVDVIVRDWNGTTFRARVRSVSRHRESQCVHVDFWVFEGSDKAGEPVLGEFRTLPIGHVVRVL
jgi:hypothetical protein